MRTKLGRMDRLTTQSDEIPPLELFYLDFTVHQEI